MPLRAPSVLLSGLSANAQSSQPRACIYRLEHAIERALKELGGGAHRAQDLRRHIDPSIAGAGYSPLNQPSIGLHHQVPDLSPGRISRSSTVSPESYVQRLTPPLWHGNKGGNVKFPPIEPEKRTTLLLSPVTATPSLGRLHLSFYNTSPFLMICSYLGIPPKFNPRPPPKSLPT